MKPDVRQRAVALVVRVLLELFPGASVTSDDDIKGELAELAFRGEVDVPFRVCHSSGQSGVFALVVKEELLEEDFDEAKLEFSLRTANLPDLVKRFPHGRFQLRPEGLRILSKG